MIVGRLEARGPHAWPDQLLSVGGGRAGAWGLVLAMWRLAVGVECGFSHGFDPPGPWLWVQIYAGWWAFEISIEVGDRLVVTDESGDVVAGYKAEPRSEPGPVPYYSALRPGPPGSGPQPCSRCGHPMLRHKAIADDGNHHCLVDGCECVTYVPVTG